MFVTRTGMDLTLILTCDEKCTLQAMQGSELQPQLPTSATVDRLNLRSSRVATVRLSELTSTSEQA
jgi:hypothetical protein